MTSVWVTSISQDWDWEWHSLRVVYHLSNSRTVHILITKESIKSILSWPITEVIKGFVGDINRQLKIKVPETLDQYKTFQAYLQDEFALRLLQLSDMQKNQTVAEWGIFHDDLAPHEECQPRVLRLIDLGDGMLVPKDFVEKILNDVPTVGIAAYADDLVKETVDPAKYFKQIMKPAYNSKGLYQSQYLQYPELKGPQPGPDKKFIPDL